MRGNDHVCPRCGATASAAGACEADGARLVARGTDALLGTTIGSYRIAKLVGRGGMGRVYLGVQPEIGAKVAIKVLLEADNDGRRVERFFAEARAVNVVRHEHIVDVLDLGTFPDGVPYMVMELVEGAPLATLIANRSPLPIASVCRLVSEVLSALAATHDKGIFHRDLKPDNVMVTPAGHPKILDFGIAKLERDGQKLTGTGVFVGTPLYAAPEQVRGAPADGRADLYAVGVILFEALTGRTPFASDSLYTLLEKHATEPPPAPSSFRPDLPRAIEAVVLTALAKTPEARYPDARAMATALDEATRDLPREAHAPLHAAADDREPRARVGGFSRTGVDLGAKDTSATPSGLAAPPSPEPAAGVPAPSPMRTFAAAIVGVLVVGLIVGYIVRARVLVASHPVEPGPSATPAAASDAPVVASVDAAPPCRAERCVSLTTTVKRVDPVVLLPEVTEAARGLEPGAALASLVVDDTPDGLVDVYDDVEGGATAAFLFRVPHAPAEHELVVASPRSGTIGVRYMYVAGGNPVAELVAVRRPPACSAGRAVAASIVAGLRTSEKKSITYRAGPFGGPDGWKVVEADSERWVDGATCQVVARPTPKATAPATSARPSPQEIRRLQAEAIRDRKPVPHWP